MESSAKIEGRISVLEHRVSEGPNYIDLHKIEARFSEAIKASLAQSKETLETTLGYERAIYKSELDKVEANILRANREMFDAFKEQLEAQAEHEREQAETQRAKQIQIGLKIIGVLIALGAAALSLGSPLDNVKIAQIATK